MLVGVAHKAVALEMTVLQNPTLQMICSFQGAIWIISDSMLHALYGMPSDLQVLAGRSDWSLFASRSFNSNTAV